jgi:hypothetical protein
MGDGGGGGPEKGGGNGPGGGSTTSYLVLARSTPIHTFGGAAAYLAAGSWALACGA